MDGGQTATITAPSGLKVFISYSREDMDFVDELELVLKDKGHEVLIDRHGISAGEEFRNRLEQMIRTCDTVVFVMTDDSLTSDACGWEIDLTKNRYNKRMLVVTLKDISEGVAVPDALAGIDWIHCWRNPRVKDSNPTKGFILLDTALRTDLAWVRQETLIYDDALQWIERGSAPDSPLLLSGELLTDAQAWARGAPDGHAVSPEVDQFIKASAQADARQKAEAEANIAEREKALEDAREAVAQREKANARAKRRTYWAAAVSSLLIAGAGAGIFYFQNLQTKVFDQQNRAAAAERKNAISRSQVIAEAAMRQLEANDVESATRLAILSFQEGKAADLPGEELRGVASANVALSLIAQEKRAVGFLGGHESPVIKYVPAAWDNLALTLTREGVMRIWDGTEKIIDFPKEEDPIRDAVFNDAKQKIITLQGDAALTVWTLDRDIGATKVLELETPELGQKPTQDGVFTEAIVKLKALPNGTIFASTSFGRLFLYGPEGDTGFKLSVIDLAFTGTYFLGTDSSIEILSTAAGDDQFQMSRRSLSFDGANWNSVDVSSDEPFPENRHDALSEFVSDVNFDLDRFVWSADSNVAAGHAGDVVKIIDVGNNNIINIDLKLPGGITSVAIAPDNQHFVAWNELETDVGLFTVDENPDLENSFRKSVNFDFDTTNPPRTSSALNAELRLGEDQKLRVLNNQTKDVIAGPFEGTDSNLSGFMFVNNGRAVLVRDLRGNILAFDGRSGIPLAVDRNLDTEIWISQTEPGALEQLVNKLCLFLSESSARTHLKPADSNALVLLNNHIGQDVCADRLGQPANVNGEQFGSGELLVFSSVFNQGVDFVLKWEGGSYDDPDDRGGRTKDGITQNTYDLWRANRGLVRDDVWNISEYEVKSILLEHYWQQVNRDWYPDKLQIVLFDTSLNMGPRRAISLLQHSINETRLGPNIAVDGAAGKTTFNALRDCIKAGAQHALLENYIQARRGVYHNIVDNRPRSAKFLNGWMNRLNDLAIFVGVSGSEFE